MNIEFIIAHYKDRRYNILSIMSSIVVQTNPNWSIHVVCDGVDDDIDFLKKTFPDFSNIKYSILDKRYNDVGHTPRNFGVKNSTSDWVVMCGNDNYYIPIFVNEMVKSIQENPKINFLYCDMIHNHYKYDLFKCLPISHHIDMGNMVTKTELAKQLPLDITRYDADGIFCGEYISKFCKEENIHYIPHILYVHN
jgi:glycosyltransferase involved in cell wall biosynthesis